jgi:enterochelin esterase-like enzyme
MHDGQNLFDPATSAFGTDRAVDESCDSLIRNMKIKPIIVAGIYNSLKRMQEYTPGASGNSYMNFVINTVKPLIDREYNTLPGRKHTVAGGSSAGGTISLMLEWYHPEIFSVAMCLSPPFRIQYTDVVKKVTLYNAIMKKLKFYIDNGGKGLKERLQPGVDEMPAALLFFNGLR